MNLPRINEKAVAALFEDLLIRSGIKEEQLWEKNQENKKKLTPLGVIVYVTFLTTLWNANLHKIQESRP